MVLFRSRIVHVISAVLSKYFPPFEGCVCDFGGIACNVRMCSTYCLFCCGRDRGIVMPTCDACFGVVNL